MVSKATEPHCRSGNVGEVERVKRVERVRMKMKEVCVCVCGVVCVCLCTCTCKCVSLTNLTPPAVKRLSELMKEE